MKLLSRIKTFFSNMATRELNLWAELLVEIIIALYYFPGAFRLIKEGKWTLEDPGAMIGLIIGTIILAIIAGALISILISIWGKPAKKDERDYRFSARGSMHPVIASYLPDAQRMLAYSMSLPQSLFWCQISSCPMELIIILPGVSEVVFTLCIQATGWFPSPMVLIPDLGSSTQIKGYTSSG